MKVTSDLLEVQLPPSISRHSYGWSNSAFSLLWLHSGTTSSEPSDNHQSLYYTIVNVTLGCGWAETTRAWALCTTAWPPQANTAWFKYFLEMKTAELEWELVTCLFLGVSYVALRLAAKPCPYILVTYFSSCHNILLFWSSEVVAAWGLTSNSTYASYVFFSIFSSAK